MTANPKMTIPDLTSAQVECLLVGLADILIRLDASGRITSVADTAKIANGAEKGWLGKTPAAIASPESVGKIEKLISADAISDGSAPWRHVNLTTGGKATIPLLVKYFAVAAGSIQLRLIAGRDLRPLQQAQVKFQEASAELERRMPRRTAGGDGLSPGGVNMLVGGTHVLGTKPIDDIVKETAERVQQAFFAEAMRHAGGDPEKAAGLLGLTTSEFLRRALLRRLN
jgi:hypothetical protein